MDFDLELPTIEEMGLDEQGYIHKLIDIDFVYYMKQKMPSQSFALRDSVKMVETGLIQVQSPYAHYMNEGIVYVDPVYGFSAIPLKDKDGNLFGFYSRPGVKKVPSSRAIQYHGGPNRGAHFVERTILENTDDIIRDITPYLGGNK